MELGKDGLLHGKVELPQDGWLHDWVMKKVARGIVGGVLEELPRGKHIPQFGQGSKTKI